MFDFFSLLVAIVALIVVRKTFNQIAVLRARLDAFESAAVQPRAAVSPPPLAPHQQADQDLATPSPEVATAQPPPLFEAESIAPAADSPDIAPADAGGSAAPAPPPLPQPAATPSFEERVGTRWVVWVGGLTLALGGFFMVRYSIEAGLVGPGVRVLLGGAFALALLAAGEWTRRKESVSTIEALPIANIPAILTAAGTAVAFATVYAAYALYDFVAPATAFVLLGLVALGTLAAALLHGPALAGLGVVAAFATPILVSSDKPDFWALYIYLAIVTAAAFTLARIRLWRWLAVTTIVLALAWTLPCLECETPMVGAHVFHVIAGFILAALLVVCGFLFGPPAEEGRIEPISSGALAAYLLGATAIVITSLHADAAMTAFALLLAGTLLIAWRAPAATGAVAAAAVLAALVFLEWAVLANPDMLVVPGALPGIGPHATDGSVSLHLTSAAIFAAGFGVAGFLAQGRSSSAILPVVWSAAAIFTPLALLIALYARIAHLDRSIPFAILAVLLAAGFGAATEILGKRDNRPGLQISIALFATGTLSALALALTFALDKGLLSIAIALMSLATAWISMQRPIPFLRSLAAILAAIVVMRTVYEPRIAGDAIGTTPIFNWLLWGYGVPALAFWGASRFLRRRGDDAPQRAVESAAILFTVLLVFLEIRHAVNGGDIYRDNAGLTEVALQVCTTLAMAIGLERLRIRSQSVVHNISAILLTVYAGLCIVFGLMLWETPIFWRIDVGGLFHQLAAARLRLASGAGAAAVLCGGWPPSRLVRQHDRGGRARSGTELSHLRDQTVLSRPDPDQRGHRRRRAVHLLDRLAGVRCGAARHRYTLQFAACAVGFGDRDRADDPEGVPGGYVDPDRGLSRAVVHVPRPGAGGDRLALPADPVPSAAGAADGRP
jgi:uncharacterized membrane protein